MRGCGIAVAGIALLGVSSCAERQASVVDCADFVATPTEYRVELAGSAGRVNEQDRQFVCQATIDSLAQVRFGEIAEQRAENPEVRSFAWQMVADHTEAGYELRQLAVQQSGIFPPGGLDAMRSAIDQQMEALSGATFDRAYMQDQVQSRRNAILLFQQELYSGSQPNLQRFAAETLPILQQHLQMAERTEAQVAAQPTESSALMPRDVR